MTFTVGSRVRVDFPRTGNVLFGSVKGFLGELLRLEVWDSEFDEMYYCLVASKKCTIVND